MPVLGHAFVGLAFGISTQPSAVGHQNATGTRQASALWLPVLVTLAYLPDIVGQSGLMAGWSEARLLGHSVLFAVAVSPAIAAALMRLASPSFSRAYLIALASLLVHDVLDLAQATDRAPLWPWSNRPVAVDLALIPSDVPHEAAVFGDLFLAFLAVRRLVQRRAGRRRPCPSIRGLPPSRGTWLGCAFILAVVLGAAVLTHSLRDAREADLEQRRALIARHAYARALETLARADRWPSAAKAGRVDYLRGEAYAGLGDRRRAEACYLMASRADPKYFSAIADLALLHASSDQSVTERRRLVAPYVSRLRSDFSRHPALPAVLARLQSRLAASDPVTLPESGL